MAFGHVPLESTAADESAPSVPLCNIFVLGAARLSKKCSNMSNLLPQVPKPAQGSCMTRTICPTCKHATHVGSGGRVGNHSDSTGRRCPATNTTATATYEPTSPTAQTTSPPSQEQHVEYLTHLRVSRRAGGGRTESWSLPYGWTFRTPIGELQGLTKAEYDAEHRRAANEAEAVRRAASRDWATKHGSYGSGNGSIHTVSGGLPGLERR